MTSLLGAHLAVDLAAAERSFTQSLAILERLTALDPKNQRLAARDGDRIPSGR
jgi:hypothetical protein